MVTSMKKLNYQLWILALSVLTLTSCSKESLHEDEILDLVTEVAPVDYSSIEIEVMELVNEYRLSQGLSALEFLNEISGLAENHNFHMIEEDEVCHDNFASRYSELMNLVDAQAVSENVAYGYSTAEAVVKAWIGSEGHRKNMEGNLTHFGISVDADAEGKLYFTHIFVRK